MLVCETHVAPMSRRRARRREHPPPTVTVRRQRSADAGCALSFFYRTRGRVTFLSLKYSTAPLDQRFSFFPRPARGASWGACLPAEGLGMMMGKSKRREAMTLPGFSAEASFYRGNGYYQPGVVLAGLRRQGEVIPQIYASCSIARKQCCVHFGGGNAYCCSPDADGEITCYYTQH
jgi:hypothetical protein